MNYKIVLTPDAQNDLNYIFKYIVFDLQSFQNATSPLDRIEKAVKSLEQLPLRFRLYDKKPWKSRNLCVMPVDNYIVLYIADKNKNIVTVVRIMYGGRNIEFLLER